MDTVDTLIKIEDLMLSNAVRASEISSGGGGGGGDEIPAMSAEENVHGYNDGKDSPVFSKTTTVLEAIQQTVMSIVRPEPIDMSISDDDCWPVTCPDGYCKHSSFSTNFVNHLTVNHESVPVEFISPTQIYDFFVDPSKDAQPKIIMLLLVEDQIKNFGSNPEFQDTLPMVIMSQRVTSRDLVGYTRGQKREILDRWNFDDYEYLIVWATGIVPCNVNTVFSLETITKKGVPQNTLTSQIYSVRCKQTAHSVLKAGQGLIFSSRDLKILTNNDKKMLPLRILKH